MRNQSIDEMVDEFLEREPLFGPVKIEQFVSWAKAFKGREFFKENQITWECVRMSLTTVDYLDNEICGLIER